MRVHLRRATIAAVAGIITALGLAGCRVYDASLLEDAGGGGGGACDDSREPPDRPDAEQDGDDGVEYVFVLRDVVLDQGSGAWADYGFNLDGLCSTSDDPAGECRPPMRRAAPVDGAGGVDNVFGGELFPLVDVTIRAQSGTSLQETARAAQEEGQAPALRLRGWNGTDNDQRVDVTITNAIFVVPSNEDGDAVEFEIVDFAPVDPISGERVLPRWDGTDIGYFRDDTFFEADPEQPLLRDDNAYVRDRTIVARLPERFEILFPAEETGVLVRLTDASAVGRISEDGETLEDVIVTGRWRLIDLLLTAENVGVCSGSAQYDILLGQLNAIADVRATRGTGGEGVECDAISVGVGFSGSRVRWGPLTPGAQVRNVCDEPGADGGVPPEMDAGTTPPDAGPSEPSDAS